MSDAENKTTKVDNGNPKLGTLDELVDLFASPKKKSTRPPAHLEEKQVRSDSLLDDLDLSFLGMNLPEETDVQDGTAWQKEMKTTDRTTTAALSTRPVEDTYFENEFQEPSLLSKEEFDDILAKIGRDMADTETESSVTESTYKEKTSDELDFNFSSNEFNAQEQQKYGNTSSPHIETDFIEHTTASIAEKEIPFPFSESEDFSIKAPLYNDDAMETSIKQSSLNEFYDVPPIATARSEHSHTVNSRAPNTATHISNENSSLHIGRNDDTYTRYDNTLKSTPYSSINDSNDLTTLPFNISETDARIKEALDWDLGAPFNDAPTVETPEHGAYSSSSSHESLSSASTEGHTHKPSKDTSYDSRNFDMATSSAKVPGDDFDNFSEFTPSFSNNKILGSTSAEIGKEVGDLYDNKNFDIRNDARLQNNNNSYEQDYSSAPDVETYQFNDSSVEKIESFNIPNVHYEEEQKTYSDPFEQEFEDVFNVGSSTHNEQDVYYQDSDNQQGNMPNYQPNNNFDDATNAQSQNWDRFDKDNYHPDSGNNWNDSQRNASYYDRSGESQNPIKKFGLIGGIVAASLMLLGLGYYYFNNGTQSSNVITIHADNTPTKVLPDNNTTEETASNNAQKNEQQQQLVDKSEAPQNLEKIAPNPSNSNSNSNVETALKAGESNSVPTNVTIAVVVKPDGSFVTEHVDSRATTNKTINERATVSGTGQLPKTNNANSSASNEIDYSSQQDRFVIDPSKLASSIQFPNTAPIGAPRVNTGDQNLYGQNLSQPQPRQELVTPNSNNATATTSGGFYVQISSQPNEELARIELNTARSRYASVIAGRQLEIHRAVLPGKGTYYRVRIPAGSRDNATYLCQNLKNVGGSCFVSR